ncbi:hypothetical protein GXB81_01570 [Paraburkholderia sp. Ac-20336]|uniref:hypothetical protein n=1 Tax=unclassified Paraburkholderia TaxID=2615204 RepID=UPI001420F421|nr:MULTISPECIES: hypothetical protein [unclassified Paraburkholderia]MBN3801751.1 hypothetical protein [Paraburkholderia sp. Ac-20336]NIF75869.1 hypothetical protein [Paraburkholderia sp. Cy-641]
MPLSGLWLFDRRRFTLLRNFPFRHIVFCRDRNPEHNRYEPEQQKGGDLRAATVKWIEASADMRTPYPHKLPGTGDFSVPPTAPTKPALRGLFCDGVNSRQFTFFFALDHFLILRYWGSVAKALIKQGVP